MRVKIALSLLLTIAIASTLMAQSVRWVIVSGRVEGLYNETFLQRAYNEHGYNWMGALVGNASARQDLSNRLDNVLLQLRAKDEQLFDRLMSEQGLRLNIQPEPIQ